MLINEKIIIWFYMKKDGLVIQKFERLIIGTKQFNRKKLMLKGDVFHKTGIAGSCLQIFSLKRNQKDIIFLIFFTSSFDLTFIMFPDLINSHKNSNIDYRVLGSNFIQWDVSGIFCDNASLIENSQNQYNARCVLITHNSFIVTLSINISFDPLGNISLKYNTVNINQGTIFKENKQTEMIDDYIICLNVRPEGDEYQNWMIDVYKNGYKGVWSSINLGYQMPAKMFVKKRKDGRISVSYILGKTMNLYESVIGEASLKIKQGVTENELPKKMEITIRGVDASVKRAMIYFEREKKMGLSIWFYILMLNLGVILMILIIGLTIFCSRLSKRRKKGYKRMKKKME